MFDSHLRFTGRDYTPTVAWLAIAAVFLLAMFFPVGPYGLFAVVAFLCSLACVALAWVTWRRSSKLTMPSIAGQGSARND